MESLRALRHRALQQALQSRPTIVGQSFRQLSQSSQQPFRTRPTQSLRKAGQRPSLAIPRFRTRRFQSSTSAPTSDADLSLSQRLRKLSREYGWSALGVYLALTALDFPLCFLAVKSLGTDRIGHWEHVVLSWVKSVVKWPLGENQQQQVEDVAQGGKKFVKEKVTLDEVREQEGGEKRILEEDETFIVGGVEGVEDHGYREAEQANLGDNASIWTQLALAYAIHKSFIFVRVPLTAAVTPKIVKTLRGWGWNIGKMPKRKTTGTVSSGGTGVNTKGAGVKSD